MNKEPLQPVTYSEQSRVTGNCMVEHHNSCTMSQYKIQYLLILLELHICADVCLT